MHEYIFYCIYFSPTDSNSGAAQVSPLEQFLLLARGVKGAAAVQLIKQVLEAQGVYVFAELLEMPNISEVRSN